MKSRPINWTVALFALSIYFVATEAVCRRSHVCIHTRRNFIQKRFSGEKFPTFKVLLKGENVSLDEVETLEIQGGDVCKVNVNRKELGYLVNLSKLYIDGCKGLLLSDYAFANSALLSIIHITNCDMQGFPFLAFDGAFPKENLIGELNFKGNRLTYVPIFSRKAPGLKRLFLDSNRISFLTNRSLNNLDHIEVLSMRNTFLKYIGNDVFNKKDNLVEFTASGSRNLSEIEENAFRGARGLKILSLDHTTIKRLPSNGLDYLETLNLEGVKSVVSLSDKVINLPRLKTVSLDPERRYLCCAFKYKRKEKFPAPSRSKMNFTKDCNTPVPRTTSQVPSTTVSPKTGNSSRKTTANPWGGWNLRRRALLWFGEWVPSNRTSTDPVKTSHPILTDDNFGKHTVTHKTAIFDCGNRTSTAFVERKLEAVSCYPEPDALRPCDDIMGNLYLTALSWIVSFIAVITNGIVFGVLIMSRRQITVTKFLIMNLAFADLCLGLYLFILTCASIETSGKYYNSVYSWQYDGGCDVIGFLAVFSSELSMIILTLITIERYLAIVYAVYLQKRLTLRHASYLSAAGWIMAIIIAILPILGANSYDEVAICLPFKISKTADIVYLGFVFGFNSLLFALIMVCYVRIYLAVAGPYSKGRPPAQTNDSSVAKRIALLVFTDFACWLPIAVIGMIAAAGHSSTIGMTVEKSKYLLVIFFPVNSICNPFLYALSTRTFQREFFTVLAQCGFCQERLHQFNTNTYTGNSAARKNLSKSRRGTETINLSVVGPALGTSKPKNGTAAGKITSPTHNPLIEKSGSIQNNNASAIPAPDHASNSESCNSSRSLEEKDQVHQPAYHRETSRTPLNQGTAEGTENTAIDIDIAL